MDQSALSVAPSRRLTTASRISTSYVPTLRSMTGLLLADLGGSTMGQIDGAFRLGDGQHIASESVTPGHQSELVQPATLHSLPSNELALSRDDTLLSLDATPARNAAELKSLLGNN